MNRLIWLGAATLLLASNAPWALAQVSAAEASGESSAAHAERSAAREHIRLARQASAEQKVLNEAACYQRFIVEDCLRAERTRSRDIEAGLRAQEIQLNDAERKEKAAARLRSIEEKKQTPPAANSSLKSPAAGTRLRLVPPANVAPKTAPKVDKPEQQGGAGAADPKSVRRPSPGDRHATRQAQNAERAAADKTRHADTLRAAQERRVRMEKQQAEAAAGGRKPAAPLPLPPASS